ncbi:MAG: hypothetical protein WAV28_18780 [Sedimentisphaerales bacterium]
MADKVVTLPEVSTSDYTKSSRMIHSGPCIVRAVHIAGDGANADCQIYDGLNDSGTLKAHLEALSGTSYTWRPADGTDFDFGIYIHVNATTTKVTVTFIPESRKKFI